ENGRQSAAVRVLPSNDVTTLDRIEKSAVTQSAQAEIWRQTFDKDSTFATVRASSGSAISTTEVNGWTVHAMSSGFADALRGREIALSSSPSLLQRLIGAALRPGADRIAEGSVNGTAVSALLHKSGLALDLPWELIPGTGTDIRWTLDRKGGLAVLEMKKE